MTSVRNYHAPLLLPLINMLVVLFVGFGLLFVSIGSRQAIDKSVRVAEDTRETALQVGCFADVYFIHQRPALTDDQRRQAVVDCIADGTKGP